MEYKHERTVIEVMDQYELTRVQRQKIMAQVEAHTGPMSVPVAYTRAHTFAAKLERITELA
jgi:hypothetical protein